MKLLHFLGTGHGHESQTKGCQDRIRTESFSDGRTVIAISDGCSSSKHAEIAAQSNVDVICNIFKSFSIDSLSFEVFAQIHPEMKSEEKKYCDKLAECFRYALQKSLYNIANERHLENNEPIDAHDYCATLLFAVCEEKQICIGHIGDGNIICFDKNGDVVYRSKEDNGEDSTHTFFTVSANFSDHFFYDVIPSDNIECIVMFSDGPQNMFKCEYGDIETGVSEMIAKPVINEKVYSDETLVNHLKEYIGHAKHYVFDDWSIVVAYNGLKTVREIKPISLNDIFMEEFKKIVFDDFGNIVENKEDRDGSCKVQNDGDCGSLDGSGDENTSGNSDSDATNKNEPQIETNDDKKEKIIKKCFDKGSKIIKGMKNDDRSSKKIKE